MTVEHHPTEEAVRSCLHPLTQTSLSRSWPGGGDTRQLRLATRITEPAQHWTANTEHGKSESLATEGSALVTTTTTSQDIELPRATTRLTRVLKPIAQALRDL